jgi:hypothetical protein
VYTKGAEECKAEQKRIREDIQRQQLAMEQLKVMGDLATKPTIRIPLINCDLECAVLVGGYKDMDSARAAHAKIKGMKLPDPTKVKLQTECSFKVDPKTGKTEGRQDMPVNPFLHSMIVPNPTISAKAATGRPPEDIALLRNLNKDESFTLLKCPKQFTLLVKAYPLAAEIQTNKGLGGKFSSGPAPKSNGKGDPAAISAHNLALLINQAKGHLHAYVWHDIHYSFVTVGEYDSENDPRLKDDQQALPTVNSQLDPSNKLMEFPRAMQVPRI